MINEIYIPDGFEYVYSPLLNKKVLRPKQGFSDNYLTKETFIPDHSIKSTTEDCEELICNNKSNHTLRRAKRNKNDEFYTTLSSIVNEVKHYKNQFKDKIVYCPCDKVFNKGRSNFFEYFSTMFHELGLKKLICTQYNPNNNGKAIIFEGRGIHWEYNGEYPDNQHLDESQIETRILNGDGSFDSDECKKIMSECDVVITNPPFSILRAFIAQIMSYNKQFLIIGPQNAITYKEIFPLIKSNKIWLGYTMVKEFEVPIDSVETDNQYYDESTKKIYQKFGNVCWFTNISHNKRNEYIPVIQKYDSDKYPYYDNYNAIEVSKVENIPSNFNGVMGVPITFLDKYNPNQFEIVGCFNGYKECDYESGLLCGERTEYVDKNGKAKIWTGPTINKKTKYFRVLIKHKQ